MKASKVVELMIQLFQAGTLVVATAVVAVGAGALVHGANTLRKIKEDMDRREKESREAFQEMFTRRMMGQSPIARPGGMPFSMMNFPGEMTAVQNDDDGSTTILGSTFLLVLNGKEITIPLPRAPKSVDDFKSLAQEVKSMIEMIGSGELALYQIADRTDFPMEYLETVKAILDEANQ